MTTQNNTLATQSGSTSLGTLADAQRRTATPPPLPSRPAAATAGDSPEVIAMKAELARLQSENEALVAKAKASVKGLSVKIAEKGGVSVYGMGRFPVTLYANQWERLLGAEGKAVLEFIAANKDNPAMKTEKPADHVTAVPAVTKAGAAQK